MLKTKLKSFCILFNDTNAVENNRVEPVDLEQIRQQTPPHAALSVISVVTTDSLSKTVGAACTPRHSAMMENSLKETSVCCCLFQS